MLALTFYPLVLLSGGLGDGSAPSGRLGQALRWLPVQPTVEAVARALDPAGGALPPARDLAVLAYWGMAGLAVCLVTFRWHPTRTT